MSRLATLCFVLCAGVLASCRRSSGSSKPAADQSPAKLVHYEDSSFSLDYPPEYKVKGSKPSSDSFSNPSVFIEPTESIRGSNTGQFTFAPDPMYPDMLVPDAAATAAKKIVEAGGRAFGGIKRLAVKNGNCMGYVEVSPLEACPKNAGFTTATGKCNGAMLIGFCASPSSKRFYFAGVLGSIPTPDALTPEAIAIGRIHEHILSTLEFK